MLIVHCGKPISNELKVGGSESRFAPIPVESPITNIKYSSLDQGRGPKGTELVPLGLVGTTPHWSLPMRFENCFSHYVPNFYLLKS